MRGGNDAARDGAARARRAQPEPAARPGLGSSDGDPSLVHSQQLDTVLPHSFSSLAQAAAPSRRLGTTPPGHLVAPPVRVTSLAGPYVRAGARRASHFYSPLTTATNFTVFFKPGKRNHRHRFFDFPLLARRCRIRRFRCRRRRSTCPAVLLLFIRPPPWVDCWLRHCGHGPRLLLPRRPRPGPHHRRQRQPLLRHLRAARLEAMMLSNPTNCYMDNGVCLSHTSRHMLQIFSLKLSKIPVDGGSVELYGYIAARDNLDPLLNYIINFSRDHPIVIEQGSLLNMTGPKRGIELVDTILIEYDMKIKIGEQEKDDVQLIDGVSIVDDMDTWHCSPFTCRIHGGCGAIDITAARLNDAVEATVEVLISEVRGSFNMRLDCFSSGIHKEIQLFDGSIGESCGLKRSVVAVVLGAQMDLKFKVSTDSSVPAEHCCSFKSIKHGHDTQEIKTDLGLISVNVVWSTLR